MKIVIPLALILALLNLSIEVPSREIIEEGSKYADDEYVNSIKVPTTELTYSSNGGERPNNKLDYAFDGYVDTCWISGTLNSNTFKSEIAINFEQTVSLEGMIYQCQNYYTQGYPRVIAFQYKLKGETEYKELKYESPDDTNKKVIFHFGEVIECDELIVRWDTITKNMLTNVATAREIILVKPENELPSKPEEEIPTATPSREIISEGSKYDNEEYVNLLRIPNTELTYSSNGGERPNNKLDYAFDGNLDTCWISGTTNSDTFKSEIAINFEQTVNLEGMIYQCQNYYTQGYPRVIAFQYKLKGETEYKELKYESADDTNQKVIFHFGEVITCDELIVRWETITKNKLTNVATAREIIFVRPEKEIMPVQ